MSSEEMMLLFGIKRSTYAHPLPSRIYTPPAEI